MSRKVSYEQIYFYFRIPMLFSEQLCSKRYSRFLALQSIPKTYAVLKTTEALKIDGKDDEKVGQKQRLLAILKIYRVVISKNPPIKPK